MVETRQSSAAKSTLTATEEFVVPRSPSPLVLIKAPTSLPIASFTPRTALIENNISKLSPSTKQSSVVGDSYAVSSSSVQDQREEKQQRLQQHFLHGIQLDSCQDLLSIPDPPSPSCSLSSSSSLSRKQARRRMSTPLQLSYMNTHTSPQRQHQDHSQQRHQQSKPFRDLSNEDLSSLADKNKAAKRSRKSLCHVPLPVETSSKPTNDLKQTSNNSQLVDHNKKDAIKRCDNIDCDNNDGCSEVSHINSGNNNTDVFDDDSDKLPLNRRKRRHSIVLLRPPLPPTRNSAHKISIPDINLVSFDNTIATSPKSHCSTIMATPVSFATPCSTKSNELSLEHIRKLVHQYTLLSGADKWQSNEVKELANLTGYTLVPPMTLELQTCSKIPLPLSIQDRVVASSQLGPQLQKQEITRLEEARRIEEITDCMVQKHKGKYRYFHKSSKATIPASAYEERYRCMLDELNTIRSKEWANYFSELEQNTFLASPLPSIARREQEWYQAKSPHSQLKQRKIDEDNGDCELTTTSPVQRLFVKGNDSPMRQISNNDERKLSHAQKVKSQSLDRTEHTSRNTQLLTNEIDDDDDSLCSTLSSDSSDSSGSNDEQDTNNGSNCDDATKLLLAIPSREDLLKGNIDNDPEIAQAEMKLWTAIDAALADYSAEVVAIRKRRKTQIRDESTTETHSTSV